MQYLKNSLVYSFCEAILLRLIGGWCVDFVFQVCLARFLSKALLLIDSFDYSRNNCWTLGGSFFVSVSAKTAFSLTMFFTSNI